MELKMIHDEKADGASPEEYVSTLAVDHFSPKLLASQIGFSLFSYLILTLAYHLCLESTYIYWPRLPNDGVVSFCV